MLINKACLNTCKLINCWGIWNHSLAFSVLIFKNFAIKFSFVQNEPEVEEEEEEEDLVVSWWFTG